MTFDFAGLWEAWPSEGHCAFNTFDETEQDKVFLIRFICDYDLFLYLLSLLVI